MTKCDRDCPHNSQGYCTKLEECQIEQEALQELYSFLEDYYKELDESGYKRGIELINKYSRLI